MRARRGLVASGGLACLLLTALQVCRTPSPLREFVEDGSCVTCFDDAVWACRCSRRMAWASTLS